MTGKLRILGTVIAVLFLGFVVWRGLDAMPPVDLTRPAVIAGLVAAVVLYTLSQVFGAFAWSTTLRAWNVALPFGRAECHVLLSQIGKYLPGNVAQFVGRFTLARADGVQSGVIGVAMLAETGLLISSGALIVVGVAVAAPELLSELLGPVRSASGSAGVWALPVLGLLTIASATVVVSHTVRRRAISPLNVKWLAIPVVADLANFAVLGVSLHCVAWVVVPEAQISLAHTTAIFAVAWIAGFIVPGAPGGVGIRDGILAIGLGMVIGDGAGLTVALLHRGVSVLGDALTFALGWLVRARVPSPA